MDSGKTALLREFSSRQRAGDYQGVPNPSDFPISLAGSFAKSPKLNGADARLFDKVSSHLLLKIVLKTPGCLHEFFLKQKDPMDRMQVAFTRYISKYKHSKGFPTIITDQADFLTHWTTTAEGAKELDAVLKFLVRISQQEGPLRGHDVVHATIGHLNEEEAKEFVRQCLNKSELKREGLEAEVFAIWDDVYAHYGGAIIQLCVLIEKTLPRSQPGFVRRMQTRNKLVLKAPEWMRGDWKKVVEAMAAAEDGDVPVEKLCETVSGAALASMVRCYLLQYREPTGWDRDIKVVSTPIVMPVTRAEHLAMREVVAQPNHLQNIPSPITSGGAEHSRGHQRVALEPGGALKRRCLPFGMTFMHTAGEPFCCCDSFCEWRYAHNLVKSAKTGRSMRHPLRSEDWKNVVEAMAAAKDGVVPLHELSVSGTALKSMITLLITIELEEYFLFMVMYKKTAGRNRLRPSASPRNILKLTPNHIKILVAESHLDVLADIKQGPSRVDRNRSLLGDKVVGNAQFQTAWVSAFGINACS
ncbi:hypothetical protein SELMODRAFT_413311 [Selaginella moellendorffii]|uniref:Uncharacterized protein n=1 Tax=Selaginella moellendorffii TaxID=88036 RepID=D8RP18_SELML|nr:hypothetical protein SELMODRAFT_413311 [Selaginella moellendorffii]